MQPDATSLNVTALNLEILLNWSHYIRLKK